MKVSFESLETRKLLTAATSHNMVDATIVATPPVSVPAPTAHLTHTGTLMIPGTSNNDKITVLPSQQFATSSSYSSADPVSIRIEPLISVLGIAGGTAEFDAASVKRIVVDAGAGNDNVTISPNIKLNTTLMGGNGNDTLIGGAGSDVLSGGNGNDVLYAATTTITDDDDDSDEYGAADDSFIAINYPDIAKYQDLISPGTMSTTPKTNSIAESSKIADSIDGGAGNDTLYASNGPDTLNGDDGTDKLVIIGRGYAEPPPILFRRGNDQRTFDGLTFSSSEAIDVT